MVHATHGSRSVFFYRLYNEGGREPYQVVVWFDAEQISEVAEGQWSVGLEAEIGVVVRRGQVAALAAMCKHPQKQRNIAKRLIREESPSQL